jgi:very-short-patch-repair endonuclease
MAKYNHHKIYNNPDVKDFRKMLRANLTPAEARLWTLLKSKQLENLKFRRQHSVGKYVLDFYCPSLKIAIELDGQYHYNLASIEYDSARTEYLNTMGIKVIRFENKAVFDHTDWVLDCILEQVNQG